jgi:hypothetical protein
MSNEQPLVCVYHPNPTAPTQVSVTITSKPISELIRIGIIREDTPHLVLPYVEVEDQTNEEYLRTYYTEFLRFDNLDAPTQLVVDYNAAAAYKLQGLRQLRFEKLKQLDMLQLRAVTLGRMDVGISIERDKQALRDLPTTLDFSTVQSLVDIEMIQPPIVHIDYEEKYRDDLQL